VKAAAGSRTGGSSQRATQQRDLLGRSQENEHLLSPTPSDGHITDGPCVHTGLSSGQGAGPGPWAPGKKGALLTKLQMQLLASAWFPLLRHFKKILMNTNGEKYKQNENLIFLNRNLLFFLTLQKTYFFSWCPNPNRSFVEIWKTSTVGTGKKKKKNQSQKY
jgi:hypothetical protein